MSKATPRSWGRIHRDPHDVVCPSRDAAAQLIRSAREREDKLLPYGKGRSYGDVCLNHGHTLVASAGLDCLLDFDRERGLITAESGVSLEELLRVAVPAGWFLPVTPGTKFVTVGGAIANDVHGKDHHVNGTFGGHVRALELLRSDSDSPVRCDPGDELFAATIGGLGLTGLITEATIQLLPITSSYLQSDEIRFTDLDQFFALSKASEGWPYTVAWVDCTGAREGEPRGIFSRARFLADQRFDIHQPPSPLKRISVEFPAWTLNRFSVAAFNQLFYAKQWRDYRRAETHYDPFFYPLDGILDWNRMYGPAGFYQFQCVVPVANELEATREILRRIALSGQASFLSVLKRFGDVTSPGLLSFPMPGTTLALDFRNRGSSTVKLLQELEKIVMEADGRIYPAKDALMSRKAFEAGYPNLSAFQAYRDPVFSSAFWRRVQ